MDCNRRTTSGLSAFGAKLNQKQFRYYFISNEKTHKQTKQARSELFTSLR